GTQDGYAFFAGTSMATPHVSGAIALAWAHPDHAMKTPAEMKELILKNARPLASLSGRCVTGATLDIGFLKPSGPGQVTPAENIAYFGDSNGQGGSFLLHGSSGSAQYSFVGLVWQSNLSFEGIETTPDGYPGWVYREDLPVAPLDFLFTVDTIGQAPYHRVYVRPADDPIATFHWQFDATRLPIAAGAGSNAARVRRVDEMRIPRPATGVPSGASGE
ncbi:MAG: S8 family serine peptidase, partial [Isosphaeraceae bacterium]